MTLESEPTTAPNTDASQAPAAPTRRRRAASRPAGAPSVEAAAVGGAAVEAATVEPAAPAAPAADATAAGAPVAESAPPVKAARRRSPRKAVADTAAPAPADAPTAEADPAGSDVAIAEPVAEVPVKTPRRRSPRKAVAAPVEPEPVEADPVQTAPLAGDLPEGGSAQAVVEDDEQAPATEVEAPVAALAMPLFQVPDPAAAQPRRRRAASRPAGPPVAVEPVADEGPVPDAVPAPEGGPEDDDAEEAADGGPRRRRRRGGRGRRGRAGDEGEAAEPSEAVDGATAADEESEPAEGEDEASETVGSRRRRRRRRRGGASGEEPGSDDPPNTVVRVRDGRRSSGGGSGSDDVTGLRGSTRLEAKKQRRREGREAGRRRPIITEAEFLARREAVNRVMVMRERDGRTQIGVLEDGVLVEHYVARRTQSSMVGNVYLGKVQNVLPSMEAAFIDIGKGRNAVLYAGEVNWDAAGLDGNAKRIEHALKSGESVLVQVTKDPIGHKGARLTSQISLPGRYLVYVPSGSMTGISRKLPDTERNRLKRILRDVVPDEAGVIVRTAAEGASEEELQRDVARLQAQWEDIDRKAGAVNAPALLYGEPDLAIRVVRDIFNEDFAEMVVSGDDVWDTLQAYMGHVAPDLLPRLRRWDGEGDVFAAHRIEEQLSKALDRKVWLPSGGSLVIDRTEAMTVVDVNTGKFTGAGGNLEETVTKNNIEAAEEIVRQLRLRDIGGIIVVDFIDMVLESNRDLVLRRLLECLGRDRTKHQVAEVTSLGLVQMTRKRVGQGLLEVFSETCEHCGGRGLVLHDEPVEKREGDGGRDQGRDSGTSGASGSGSSGASGSGSGSSGSSRRGRGRRGSSGSSGSAPSASEGGSSGAGLTA